MSATVDAHVHLWNRSRHPQDWIDPATMNRIDRDFGLPELQRMLTRTAASAAVLVQSTNSLAETVDLLALAAGPEVFGVVGWIDLTGDVHGQLAELRGSAGGEALCGVRHLAHIEQDAAWLLRSDVASGLHALADHGLAFDLILRDYQLPLAASVARAHPELTFVLDHLGNPAFDEDLTTWRHNITALAAEPNVVAKLSGVATIASRHLWTESDLAKAVGFAVETFGPSRLLYGSDYPLVELANGAGDWAATLRRLLTSLSQGEQDDVFGGTAASVYHTSVTA